MKLQTNQIYSKKMKIEEILIIGAGPAGLTAAWEADFLHGIKTTILGVTRLLVA